MITLLSTKDIKIAEKYNIDHNRSVIHNEAGKEPTIITELDYVDNETQKPTNYKHIIAYTLKKEDDKYIKYINGEIDYHFELKNNEKIVVIDDYTAIRPYFMNLMLNHVENSAISGDAKSVLIASGINNQEYYLDTNGYNISETHSNYNLWQKSNLTLHKFTNSYQMLDCYYEEQNEKM